MLIHSAVITGSVQLNNTDVSSITNVAGFATTSSVNALSSSIVSVVKSKMDTDGVVSGSSQLTSSYDNRYVLSGSIISNWILRYYFIVWCLYIIK